MAATHRWTDDLRFVPTKEDTFENQRTGMEIRFKRNEDGEVTGYYASLWEARDVWFWKQDQEMAGSGNEFYLALGAA